MLPVWAVASCILSARDRRRARMFDFGDEQSYRDRISTSQHSPSNYLKMAPAQPELKKVGLSGLYATIKVAAKLMRVKKSF